MDTQFNTLAEQAKRVQGEVKEVHQQTESLIKNQAKNIEDSTDFNKNFQGVLSNARSNGTDNQAVLNFLSNPVVTEKSNLVAEKRNQMVFKVLKDATKTEIKAAVELLFNVKVASVTTTTTKAKVKRFGRTLGRRSDVKKAYISLVAGQELDLEAAAAAADKE